MPPRPGASEGPVLATQNYTIQPVALSYSGNPYYPGANIPYGTQLGSALLSLPAALPDPTPASNGDKFILNENFNSSNDQKGVQYGIYKAAPGSAQSGEITAAQIAKQPAGTQIVAAYRYVSKPNYNYLKYMGTVLKIFTIVKANADAPNATEIAVAFKSGSAPAKPAAPQKVNGYTGVFTKAVATDSSVSPAKETDVSDWVVDGTDDSKNLNKLSAGTKITVTYTYTLDDKNYEGTATVVSTQLFTVT